MRELEQKYRELQKQLDEEKKKVKSLKTEVTRLKRASKSHNGNVLGEKNKKQSRRK